MDKGNKAVIKSGGLHNCRRTAFYLAIAAAAASAVFGIYMFTQAAGEAESAQVYEPFGANVHEAAGLPSYTVTEQRAWKIAESFLKEELAPAGRSYDVLPCYEFEGENAGVSVTAEGGAVMRFQKNCEYEDCERGDEELASAARDFLLKMGFGETEEAGLTRDGGRACAYMLPVHESGALLYTDAVRIYINMKTMDVTGMDAQEYILNHRFRNIKTEIDRTEAIKSIPSSFVIEQPVTAVIGGASGEKTCYRFKCFKRDFGIMIFVNAKDGKIEEILPA